MVAAVVSLATKRARYDGDRSNQFSPLSICVSPNGCCVAFTSTDTITVSSLCPYILGEKGEINGGDYKHTVKCIQGSDLFIKDVEGGFVMNSLQVIHQFKAMSLYMYHITM